MAYLHWWLRLDLVAPPTEVRITSTPIQNSLILGLFIGLASTGLVRQAAAKTDPAALRLRVFVYNLAQVPDSTLARSQQIASQVYRNAGIDTEWFGCPTTGEEETLYPDCMGPLGPGDVFLRILPTANASFTRQVDAFGVALISPDGRFSRMAYINFDRVDKWTWGTFRFVAQGRVVSHVPPGDRCALTLGVVMAHELGHLLLGSHSHSRRGIMQAGWNLQQLEDAYDGRQGFSPTEVTSLRTAVRLRARAGHAR